MAASGRLGLFETTLNQNGLFPHLSHKEVLALSALPDSDLMRYAAQQLIGKWGDGLFVDDSGKFIVTETHFIYLVDQKQHNRQNAQNIEGKTEIAKLFSGGRFWVKVPHPAGLRFERDERVSEIVRLSKDEVFLLTTKNHRYSYNIITHHLEQVPYFLCGGHQVESVAWGGASEVTYAYEPGRTPCVIKLSEGNQVTTSFGRGETQCEVRLDPEEKIEKLCSMKRNTYFYTDANRVFTLSQSANISTFVAKLDNQIIDMALTSDNIYLLCNNGLFEKRNQQKFVPVQVDLHDGEQITSLSTSLFHAFFITNQNRIFCIGRNEFGQLGLGDKEARTELSKCNLNLKHDQKILGVTCGTEFTILHTNQGNLISGKLFNSAKISFHDEHNPTFQTQTVIPLSKKIIEISLLSLWFLASVAATIPVVISVNIAVVLLAIPLTISIIASMVKLFQCIAIDEYFALHSLVLDAINEQNNEAGRSYTF